MKTIVLPGGAHQLARRLITIICAILLLPGPGILPALQAQQTTDEGVRIPADQLDSLVAPIALYPDPLLSQTLVASTYPLEIIQLQQWLEKNPGLKDKALVDAVEKQPWDPSIQATAALPDVVKRLADNIQWTTDLGNAFLAQQSDVMDAVQRMRVKAEGTGALVSNDHQKVQTEVIEGKSVVVVEQAQPEVIYVPDYNPSVVYGAPAYPYPSMYYPPYYGGAVAASAISWGVGLAMGAAWGGGWGWGAGWGHNDIDMNFNNSFNRNANVNRAGNRTGNNTWQHNPQHRGGAPYSNRATANRYGSNARGDSLASRQKGAGNRSRGKKAMLPAARLEADWAIAQGQETSAAASIVAAQAWAPATWAVEILAAPIVSATAAWAHRQADAVVSAADHRALVAQLPAQAVAAGLPAWAVAALEGVEAAAVDAAAVVDVAAAADAEAAAEGGKR